MGGNQKQIVVAFIIVIIPLLIAIFPIKENGCYILLKGLFV